MTTYSTLPLYSDASYYYTTTLEGQSYKLSFSWNERAQQWFFSLSSESGNSIVSGERLVPNFPLLLDYKIPGLTGYFFLFAKSEINSEQYLTSPRELDQFYDLYYIYG